GYPVLYFHSNTGGELECDHGDEVLLQYGIRLISVSRPGYGESDSSPQYSLLNHAEDIKQLLDQLSIQHCAILSLSSGATHALACCHHMPERVRHLCMVGPTGLQISKDAIALYAGSFGARIFARLSLSMPKVMQQVIEIGHNMFSHDLESFWQKVDPYLCDNDRLEISKHRESMISAFLQANQRGNRQAAKEIALLIQPWDFEPANIQTPVTVWHGQQDPFTPIAVCRNMVARLQNVELHEIEHEGFYMTFKQWPNIIEGLAKNIP
ncbi:MAG: alpha/beta hydrolase, partial [Mariprofundus sp.]|nr:alpha/beta hydrolase [Mariprofundus sp.]